MINWILGGLIVAFTAWIVVKNIRQRIAGKNPCGNCKGCSSGSCGLSPMKK